MSLQALEDDRSQGILSKVPYSCILLISKIWRKENLKINHPILPLSPNFWAWFNIKRAQPNAATRPCHQIKQAA